MRILILSFAFLLSIAQLYGEGYQIEVHLMNQTILEGELGLTLIFWGLSKEILYSKEEECSICNPS